MRFFKNSVKLGNLRECYIFTKYHSNEMRVNFSFLHTKYSERKYFPISGHVNEIFLKKKKECDITHQKCGALFIISFFIPQSKFIAMLVCVTWKKKEIAFNFSEYIVHLMFFQHFNILSSESHRKYLCECSKKMNDDVGLQ